MDMRFPGKASRIEAPLDHDLLLAALAAQRATDTARPTAAAGASEEPLTEIVLAGPDWRRAKTSQQGSFNRDEAERRA